MCGGATRLRTLAVNAADYDSATGLALCQPCTCFSLLVPKPIASIRQKLLIVARKWRGKLLLQHAAKSRPERASAWSSIVSELPSM